MSSQGNADRPERNKAQLRPLRDKCSRTITETDKMLIAKSGRFNLWRKEKASVEVRLPMCYISRAALMEIG